MKRYFGFIFTSIVILAAFGAYFVNRHEPKKVEPIFIVIKDGKYIPDLISAKAGEPIKMQFLRKDRSGCSEVVRFPSLDTIYALPLNQPVDIVLPAQKPGIYLFTCKGNQYQGRLTVF